MRWGAGATTTDPVQPRPTALTEDTSRMGRVSSVSGSEDGVLRSNLAGIWAVEVPVPSDDREPRPLGVAESANRLIIRCPPSWSPYSRSIVTGWCRGRSVAGDREDRLVRIAKRTLPEARVAGGNVDVAGQAAKIIRLGGSGPHALRIEVPAVEHRDA